MLETSFVYSYTVTYQEWREPTRQEIGLKCADGSRSFVYYSPPVGSRPYMSSKGSYYASLESAANQSCASKRSTRSSSKTVTIKDSSLVCEDVSDLEHALKDKSNYSYALIAIGADNDCIKVKGNNLRVTLLKKYYVKDKGYIDNFCKVKAADGEYYVRESDLK